jgi:general L-amino acid transport system substrate-binding protein
MISIGRWGMISRLIFLSLVLFGLITSAAASTLEIVKQRGKLVCGVNEGLLGFSIDEGRGKWSGFDVDFCRAVAAGIFTDAGKVEFMPLSTTERFDALRSGKIDILSRNSTWTMSRETELGLSFVGVSYYDGQGFMVPRSANITSALELSGAKVCVQGGTTSEANVQDYFKVNNMTFEPLVTTSAEASLSAYEGKRCNVITSDVSQLHAERLKLAEPDDHVILADIISKEPLGPAVRQDDSKWTILVKWVYFALLDAEELGITSETVQEALGSAKPEVRRFVGLEGGLGQQMGLSNDWAINIVRMVGNYGEIYDRNLGVDSKLAIPRGLNHLWTRGGIQYAPPMR